MSTDRSALADLEAEIVSCFRCPRLVAWREAIALEKVKRFRDEPYWGRPLPGFGDPDGRILIVGLAPAAHGGNRTGRVFTGDASGDFLWAALHRAGLADRASSRRADDGLTLTDVRIAAAVRCAPPANKPTIDERDTCAPFLARELRLLTSVRVIVALGAFGWDATLRVLTQDGHLPATAGLCPAPASPRSAASHPKAPSASTTRTELSSAISRTRNGAQVSRSRIVGLFAGGAQRTAAAM